MQCTLTDLPLLAAEAQDMKEHREEADSKRIHEQHMEPGIVDHAIHDFLSARGEADRWGALPPVDQTTKSLSDLHTGISSLGDSTLQITCPSLPGLPQAPLHSPSPSSHPFPPLHLLRHPNGEVTLLGTSTLTVNNPSTTSCPAGRPRT